MALNQIISCHIKHVYRFKIALRNAYYDFEVFVVNVQRRKLREVLTASLDEVSSIA